MKRIIIEIEDGSYGCVVGTLQICKGVRVVSVEDEQLSTEEEVAACVASAIAEVRADKGKMTACDFTCVYILMNQYQVDGIDGFRSPQAYLDYLKLAGVEHLPHRATIAKLYNNVRGVFPNWEFSDTDEPQEIMRRMAVAKQFISAFNRAKRALNDK